jgi:hypothetical protein
VSAGRILLAAVVAALAAAAPAQAGHGFHDTLLKPGQVRAHAAQATTRVFQDGQGNPIRISTPVPGLDLAPYARLLAGIPLHGREIQFLNVEVASPATVAAICGSEDAAACYGADDPGRSPAGHMYLPMADRDLAHIVVHEYGHHMDNQLLNLSGLGYGCGVDGDGSRRWFFARDVEDRIFNRGYDCSAATEWNHLLPELFAEDFTRANGLKDWVMPVPPPSRAEIDALKQDIAHPFRRSSSRARIAVARTGEYRKRISVSEWTALGIRLSVPRGRDFNLFVYEPGGHRPLIKSAHSGSGDERIGRVFFAPGNYTVVVRSAGGAGGAKLKLAYR